MCNIWISCQLAPDRSQVDVDMTRIVGFAACDTHTRIFLRFEGAADLRIDVRETPEELADLMNDAKRLPASLRT